MNDLYGIILFWNLKHIQMCIKKQISTKKRSVGGCHLRLGANQCGRSSDPREPQRWRLCFKLVSDLASKFNIFQQLALIQELKQEFKIEHINWFLFQNKSKFQHQLVSCCFRTNPASCFHPFESPAVAAEHVARHLRRPPPGADHNDRIGKDMGKTSKKITVLWKIILQ